MPRPKSKSELLRASESTFQELEDLIDSISPSDRKKEFPFQHRDRNIRDVLAHLYEWQLMMLGWYKTGMDGGKPEMPAKGYTWKTTPELNQTLWNKHQNTSLRKIRSNLSTTHQELLDLIESHSNKELFTKRLYSWTGSTSLGSYLTSALSSHYMWGIKLLRQHVRLLDES